MERSIRRKKPRTSRACRGAIGHRQWTLDQPLNLRKAPLAPHQSPEAQTLVGRIVPPVLEKVQGKRAVTDELARKKRKTAGVNHRKPGDISLGGDQTTRTRSAAMSEWSDDDGALVAPSLSTKAPPRNTRMEEQSKEGEGVPEQRAKGVPEQQTRGVLEQ